LFCQETKWKIWTDHQKFYDRRGARDLLLGLAAASLLGNTSVDHDFRDWYQDDVHSSGTEDFAQAWDAIGDGRIFVPALARVGVLAEICGHTPCAGALGDFGCRRGRAYLAGAPPVVRESRPSVQAAGNPDPVPGI
jgi:hypothetical protein